MKRIFGPPVGRLLLGLMLGICIWSGCEKFGRKNGPGHQTLAPDFTLPNWEDRNQATTLSDLTKDHRVLLVFWATWCPSCVHEIPILNGWLRDYSDQGLVILGINVGESPERIRRFQEKIPIDYPVLLDRTRTVAGRYGISGLPVAVMLAKGGQINYYGFGLPHIERYFDPPAHAPTYEELAEGYWR